MTEFKCAIEKSIHRLLSSTIYKAFGLYSLDFTFEESNNLPWNSLAVVDTTEKTIYINMNHNITKKYKEEDILTFIILHELTHPQFEHTKRRKHRDRNIWNIACDFAINSFHLKLYSEYEQLSIKENSSKRISIPDITKLGIYYHEDFSNKLEEEIYDILMNHSKSESSFVSLPDMKNVLSGKSNECKESKTRNNDSDIEIVTTTIKYKDFVNKSTEVIFPGSLEETEDEGKISSSQLAKKLLESTLQKGNFSSSFKEYLGKLFYIKIDFKEILRAAIRTHLERSMDIAWSRPNPIWLSNSDQLPYLPYYQDEEKYGTVVFMIDESGSVSSNDLKSAISIVIQSKEYFKNLYVIKHDTKCGFEKIYEDISDEDIKELSTRKHCGGTSHKEPFEKVKEYIKKSDSFVSLVVGVTDLCSDLNVTQGILDTNIPRIWIVGKHYSEVPELIGNIIQVN